MTKLPERKRTAWITVINKTPKWKRTKELPGASIPASCGERSGGQEERKILHAIVMQSAEAGLIREESLLNIKQPR